MKAKVLVVLPSDRFLQRQILEGVLKYGRTHGPWQFHFETGNRYEQALGKGRAWGMTGAIAMVRERKQLQDILSLGTPAVLINPPIASRGKSVRRPPRHIVFVNRNQEDIGRSAAEYYLERGYSRFAFVGLPQPSIWMTRRKNGFLLRLRKNGFGCDVYRGGISAPDFDHESQELSDWLRTLRPGTALFAVTDRRALQVLGCCADIGISVPETLAVLGTDNDEVLCESVSPSLSSIALDGENCGLLCATLLDRLLHRRTTEPLVDLAYPRVITRQSTDTTLVEDPFLARALDLVRRDLAVRRTVDSLAHQLSISKRTLETKARLVLGRTLREEIESIRLNEAVRLLSNSSIPIAEVAARCGFCGASHLGLRFRAAFGHTPSVFRYQDPR